MTKGMDKLKLNRVIVDASELAGNINIFVPMTGRTLYKRLREALNSLIEPGILVADFRKINLVDSSALIISIAKLLAFSQNANWRRIFVCSNTSELHQTHLNRAIIVWTDLIDPWGEKASKQRLLLLVSDRENDNMWQLLGELNKQETMLWDLIREAESITITDLGKKSGMDKKTTMSHLQVFLDNQVLIRSESEKLVSIRTIYSLMTADSGGKT